MRLNEKRLYLTITNLSHFCKYEFPYLSTYIEL